MTSPPRPKPATEPRAEDRPGRFCGLSLRSLVVGHWQAANGDLVVVTLQPQEQVQDVLGRGNASPRGAEGRGLGPKVGEEAEPTEPRPVCSAWRLVDPGADDVGFAW